jgi:hypothetical protein
MACHATTHASPGCWRLGGGVPGTDGFGGVLGDGGRGLSGLGMPERSTDPLAGIDRLVVDGTNLLFALRRGAGTGPAGTPLPAAALVGRLRGAIQAGVAIELVLDGPPDRGLRGVRIASGLTVRYAAPLSADAAIGLLAGRLDGPARSRLLVVTDDRELRQSLSMRGVRTAGAKWLIGRLERARLSAPTSGNPRPPAPPPRSAGDSNDEDSVGGRGWHPGRGATTKRGNPKRQKRARGPG